jgi:hypothetical protein
MNLWHWTLAIATAISVGYSLFRGSRPRRRLRRFEAQTLDNSREVEARINNRLTMLDELIAEADQEIGRLQTLLAQSRPPEPAGRQVTAQEQQRCFAMREAGFTVEEIARCLHASPESVQFSLDEWQRPERRAA